MMKRLVLAAILFGLANLCQAQPVQAQTEAKIEVTLDTSQGESATSREEKAQEQLSRLLGEYDLDPWIFTREVLIKAYAIPRSHPVLRLSTRYINDDAGALSTFLHEQAHWHAEAHEKATSDAIADLRERYPNPPSYEEIGTRSGYSTYLHLIVNWQELDGTAQYIGEEKARELLASSDHYEWIYEQVLQDTSEIGRILADHGLLITPGEGLIVNANER